MEHILRQLRNMGIEPANPPDRQTIRERAGAEISQLGLAALEQWRQLLGYHHTLPVRLVEAACDSDSGAAGFDRFCLGIRQLLKNAEPQSFGAAAGAAFCLTISAGFHLECGHPEAVWRGLYAFFFGRPIGSRTESFEPDELRENLDWLREECGYDSAQQMNLLTCWLAACHPDDWESTILLLQTFLEYHGQSLDQVGVRDCMAFWLRAVGTCPDEPNSKEVLHVGGCVLESLEAQRSYINLLQRQVFDEKQAWGFFTWAITALARCLPAADVERERIIFTIARYLEGFSARMALNAMARPSPTLPAIAPGGTLEPRSYCPDPKPNEHEAGISWTEFRSTTESSWKALFEAECTSHTHVPEAAYAAVQSGTHPANRAIPVALYDSLSRSFEPDQWSHRIPSGAAFLGAYELPHSGRPVVVLAYNAGSCVVWDVAAGDVPSNRDASASQSDRYLSPLFARGLREQNKCEQAWARYERKLDGPDKALAILARTLCSAVVGFHQQGLNPVFGPLIDNVVETVETQLGGEGSLAEADLIFCPRGSLNMAAPAIVGGRRKLARIFRSITNSPSLAVFSHLKGRAGGQCIPNPPRLNVLTWCPENSSAPRRLMKRATEELSQITDLWLAAERPMTTLNRASQMTAMGDWNMIFAHGVAAPTGTGAKLADGLFPAGLTPGVEGSAGAGVLFLLSCLAGRLAQTPPFVDAFGPITQEAVLTFCLSDRLRRPATLVGAFTQIVEGHAAVDIGVELVRRRVHSVGGPTWAGFARALNGLVDDVLSSKNEQSYGGRSLSYSRLLEDQLSDDEVVEYVRLAGNNPMHFLGVYSCLHFRLTGCEPTFIPAD